MIKSKGECKMLIKSILIISHTIQIILAIYGIVLIHQMFKNIKK